MARRHQLLMLSMMIAIGTFAASGNAAATDQAAYDAALKCYVANTVAATDRERAGDTAKAQKYNANAKRAFDGAVMLGRGMGFSNGRMNGDLDKVEALELSRMVPNSAYFRDAVATCKAVGLM